MSEWIKITDDNKPKGGLFVMASFGDLRDGIPFIGRFDLFREEYQDYHTKSVPVYQPTHFLELPNPPKYEWNE